MFIQYVFSLLTNIEGVEGIVMNMHSRLAWDLGVLEELVLM